MTLEFFFKELLPNKTVTRADCHYSVYETPQLSNIAWPRIIKETS